MTKLSHVDSKGKARMVDVGGKEISHREAVASVVVVLNESAYQAIKDNTSKKGDVLTVAKLAGIQAAKKTSELIPLCHQVPLDNVEITFTLDDTNHTVTITAAAVCAARTGVEMEALTACSVAALTVYDMLKAIQKDIVITDLRLLKKKGGVSGEFKRNDS